MHQTWKLKIPSSANIATNIGKQSVAENVSDPKYACQNPETNVWSKQCIDNPYRKLIKNRHTFSMHKYSSIKTWFLVHNMQYPRRKVKTPKPQNPKTKKTIIINIYFD